MVKKKSEGKGPVLMETSKHVNVEEWGWSSM
jgi:hypothetical protein